MNPAFRWAMVAALILTPVVLPFFFLETSINDAIDRVIAAPPPVWVTAGALVALLALDIVLPIPASVTSIAGGAFLGFWGGTAATLVGLSIGCLFAYVLGRYAAWAVSRKLVATDELDRVRSLWERYGDATIVLLRAVPVLAEASAIFAGLVAMPRRRFFLLTTLSNLGIAIAYSAVGALALNAHSFLLAFAAAIILPGLALLLLRRLRAGKAGVVSRDRAAGAGHRGALLHPASPLADQEPAAGERTPPASRPSNSAMASITKSRR